MTGFWALLPFISFPSSKSLAESLAKSSCLPLENTHFKQLGSERIAKSLPSNRSPLGSEGQEVLRFLSRQEWLSLENLEVQCFTERFQRPVRAGSGLLCCRVWDCPFLSRPGHPDRPPLQLYGTVPSEVS